jgi:prohibitin 2
VDRRPMIVLVAAACVVLLATSATCVPAGHRGVVTSFGRVQPDALGEGLHWVAPWKRVHDRSIQQCSFQGEAACFSSDMQTVTVQYTAMVRQPADRVLTLYQTYYGDAYLSLVEPRIQERIKQITATYPAQELVRKREAIRAAALASVREAVGDLMEVVDLSLTNIDLTDELEKAIESKMVMEQQAQAKSFELDRERKNAEITVVKAGAEAQAVKIKGEAIAANPRVIDLEVVSRWDGRSPQTVVVGAAANPVLPLVGGER